MCASYERHFDIALLANVQDTFARLVKQYGGRLLKGPFNVAARDLAGLPREWYEQIAL